MIKLPLDKREAYLVTDKLTREYLSGVKLSEGYLIYSNAPVYLCDARYFSAAKPIIENAGFTAKLYKGLEDLKGVLKAQRVKRLFIDFDKTTLSEYSEYLELGVKIYDGSRALTLTRAIKNEEEITSIKKACSIAQNAFYTVLKDIKKGVTENYIKDRLEQEMLKGGAEGVSFETIVAFGANSAVPHHQTGETQLSDNSVVLIDMGCKYNGYCSDITRTVFFGEPSQKFIESYNSVLSANQTAIGQITEGMPTDVADRIARDVLEEHSLSEYFTHSLGHGVGLEIHEFPALSPKKREVLENGMVFTIEPGVYFEGEFGIRIEDTVLLCHGKVNRLYSDDKELIIIK